MCKFKNSKSFIEKKLNLLSTLLIVSFENVWGPQKILFKAKSDQILDSWHLSMP